MRAIYFTTSGPKEESLSMAEITSVSFFILWPTLHDDDGDDDTDDDDDDSGGSNRHVILLVNYNIFTW